MNPGVAVDGVIYGQNSQDMFGELALASGNTALAVITAPANRTCLGELALASGDTALSVITVP